MTTISEFMAGLAAADVKLWLDGERIRCNAPNEVMTPALRAELTARKAEIIQFLLTAASRNTAGMKPVPCVSRDAPLELSYGQKRLLALAQFRQDSSAYHISSAFRLKGPIQLDAVEKSLTAILRRHEILRTTFPASDGSPRQVIAPPYDVSLPIVDLGTLPAEMREAKAMDMLRAEMQQPFNVASGPLWRTRLIKLGEDDHILAFTMHHLVFDGLSKNVLNSELAAFYNAFLAGHSPELEPLPVQYADFAHWNTSWLDSEDARRQTDYWQKQLGGQVSELMIPASRARPAVQTFRSDHRSFHVPPELLAALGESTRHEGVSLFISLLAAFKLMLHCHTEQEDLVICSPVACRNRSELEQMIGYFNNVVVMRTDLSGNPTVSEFVGRVREAALGAYGNQDVPIQKLAELPGLARTPLTRAMFSFRNTPERALDLDGIAASPVDIRKLSADFDMAMYTELREGNLGGTLEFNTDIIDTDTARRLSRDYLTVLEFLVTHPDRHISEAPRLGTTPDEVEALLARHPQVAEVAVVIHKNRPGFSKLAAYVVPDQFNIPSMEGLRGYLAQRLPDYLIPYAFVPVDGLPRTGNGQVDRDSLPAPASLSRPPEREYVAPSTPLEQQLAEIWARVLWLDQKVGIRDNFFDLGGHSLLSVQLVTEMEGLLKRKLPAAVLSGLSTIEELTRQLDLEDKRPDTSHASVSPAGSRDSGLPAVPATWTLSPEIYHGLLAHTAAWQGKRIRPTSLVMGLNTTGTKQKLFWCCQGFRELTQLAKYMGADQPVYGMRSIHKVLENKQRTQPVVNALAAQYVSEILEVQPDGPFLLGGNCQSAQIAFQVARQLMDRGHYITLLCLQEQFIPQHYPGRVALFYGDDSTRNPFHYFNQPETTWKKFYTGKFSSNAIAGRHSEFFREPNIQVLTAKLRAEIDRAQSEPPIEIKWHGNNRGPGLPAQAYRAGIRTIASVCTTPGDRLVIPVEIRNMSPVTWPGGEAGVTLGQRWRWKHVVISVDPGIPLPADLEPGGVVTLDLQLASPLESRRYSLELDMVEGGDTWFKDKGSSTHLVRVRVHWLFKVLRLFGRIRKSE
ncbi:MAG: condensation domain-containing protein [bacterium]